MNTLFVGKNFVLLPEVDSTNTAANALLESNAVDGTAIRAISQTKGRGQLGSNWETEAGQNLTISLILYPQFLASKQIFVLNKMVACALRDTVTEFLPNEEVLLKWPNDILINRKKVAGILIENNLEQGRFKSSIIGIGLNVNQVDFDSKVHGKATSMCLEGGTNFDIEVVMQRLFENLEARYLALRAGRTEQVERDYLANLYGYQEDSLAEINGEKKTVHIAGVAADGRLALQEAGKLYFYGLKEIRFLL